MDVGKSSLNDAVIIHRVDLKYSGFHRVIEADLRHPGFDGSDVHVQREAIERADAAALLLIDRGKGEVVLCEQFRYPAFRAGSGWTLEIPAGVVEGPSNHTNPIEAARTALRESVEETGLDADDLKFIACFHPSPGSSTERIHLYLGFIANDSDRASPANAGNRAEGEDIRVVRMPVADFIEGALAGQFDDAKTLIAGLWLASRRQDLKL